MSVQSKSTEKHVCLAVGQETSTFSRRLVAGVIEYARRHPHFRIILHEAQPYTPWAKLAEYQCDGVIAAAYNADHVARLRATKAAVVNVSSATISPSLVTVHADNERIGRFAAAHLLEKHLEHFAFVGLSPSVHDETRLAGFAKELARKKFTCTHVLVPRDIDVSTDGTAYQDFVLSLAKPVGVLASNDKVAFGVLDACRRAGLRVPDEVAVVGCDNDEMLCQLAHVTLSSVDPAADMIGTQAAETLDRLMHGHRVATTPVRVRPRGLEMRNSTDIRGILDVEVAAAVRFIRDHSATFIDVNDVLGILSVGRRVLERRFQAALGHGIYEEIHRVHIERAKRLLARPELSLTQVALSSGYHGVTRFQANFRRITGMSAVEYRRSVNTGAASLI